MLKNENCLISASLGQTSAENILSMFTKGLSLELRKTLIFHLCIVSRPGGALGVVSLRYAEGIANVQKR